MNDFEICPARPQDVHAIRELAAETPEAPHWGQASWAAYLVPGDGARSKLLLIARHEAGLAAFAAASLLAGVAEVESMAVHPAVRRRGVGALLLEAVLTWAADRGAAEVLLEVREGNGAAQALYRAAGFGVIGRRPAYYRDPAEDALILRRVLPIREPSRE